MNDKIKFTKNDSIAFKEFEQLKQLHGDSLTTSRMPKGFIDKYNMFIKPSDKEEVSSYAGSDKFRKAESIEDSAWVNKNKPVIESLDKLYNKDLDTFKADSLKYDKLGKDYKDKKNLWEAREGEVDWLNFDWVFNTYDKESSLGILNKEMRDIQKERHSLGERWFNKGMPSSEPVPGTNYTGREKLQQRRSKLDELNKELLIREDRLNKIKNKNK